MYHVDLLTSEHTLLDLVIRVFEILRNKEKKTQDNPNFQHPDVRVSSLRLRETAKLVGIIWKYGF